MGSRSQSARTYLERHLDEFPGSSLDELISHGLKALKGCLPAETELTGKVCIYLHLQLPTHVTLITFMLIYLGKFQKAFCIGATIVCKI